MVLLESTAASPGAHLKELGHSASQGSYVVPVQIPRQTLLISAEHVRDSLLESFPKDSHALFVQVFVQRQAPLKQSGNPKVQHLGECSMEESRLEPVLVPISELREYFQNSPTSSLELPPHDSGPIQDLDQRQVSSDSSLNNQAPPRKATLLEALIRAFEIWWTIIVAGALAGGNNLSLWSKRPMKYMPAFLLVMLSILTTMNLIAQPMCDLTLVANHIPYCPQNSDNTEFIPDFLKLVSFQNLLARVIEESANSSLMAIDLKDSEKALVDVMALVMQSPPRIKRVLSEEFRPVIVDANSVGQDLQRFSSRFGGDVNDILALNEHVLQLLEKMAHKAMPLHPEVIAARRNERKVLWYQMKDLMKTKIDQLISEVKRNSGKLGKLEERLGSANSVLINEYDKLGADKAQVITKAMLHQLELRRQLLNEAQERGTAASNHVARALSELQRLSTEFEELVERASTPAILVNESKTPLEVHIQAMKKGTERLLEVQKLILEREDKYR